VGTSACQLAPENKLSTRTVKSQPQCVLSRRARIDPQMALQATASWDGGGGRLASSGGGESFPLPVGMSGSTAEERRDPTHREQVIQLFREIRTPLYSYLVCIGLKPHEADDIVQEAFLRLHHQLQSGAKIVEPRAWVFRVARNVSLNVQRVQRRLVSETDLDPKDDLKLQQRFDAEQNPEEVYLRKEAMRRLDAGIAQLTEHQRQCVSLRAQGLRYREIAVVLGLSVSTVAELLQRAIVRLAGEIHG
jgi:RNA polymerase sigma-70 factor, ECF subfamily